jgi:hypothetical protein
MWPAHVTQPTAKWRRAGYSSGNTNQPADERDHRLDDPGSKESLDDTIRI